MRQLATLVLLSLVSACAMTPSEIVQSGERFTADLQHPPADAAKCILVNAENFSGILSGRIDSKDHGKLVAVQLRTDTMGSHAVIELEPEGKTARARLWVRSDHALKLTSPAEFVSAILNGC